MYKLKWTVDDSSGLVVDDELSMSRCVIEAGFFFENEENKNATVSAWAIDIDGCEVNDDPIVIWHYEDFQEEDYAE